MNNLDKLLCVFALILICNAATASNYLKLPDGTYMEVRDNIPEVQAVCRAYSLYPQVYSNQPPNDCSGNIAAYLAQDVSLKVKPKVIPLPNGTWFPNPNNLSHKEIYCKSYIENPNAWAGYEYGLNGLGCKAVSNTNSNAYTNTWTKSNSSTGSIDKTGAVINGLIKTLLGALVAGIFYFLLKPKSNNTPILYARWLACRFSVLLVWISVEEGIKYFQQPNVNNYFLGSIYLTVIVYVLAYAIAYLMKKRSLINNGNLDDGNDAWQTALNESESSARDNGLWAKCFAEADGDEAKAKARYIKYRVEQLKK